MGSLVGVLVVLIGIVFGIKACDKGASQPSGVASAAVPSASLTPDGQDSSSASATRGRPDASLSPFDIAWSAAADPEPTQNFDAMFSTVMSKADFCATYGCGDEFTRDEKWQSARERAKALQAGTWRGSMPIYKPGILRSVEGFEVGECVPARMECPITVEWPRELGGKDPTQTLTSGRTSAAPSRPSVKRMSVAAGGEAANVWDTFKAPVLAAKFPDVESARAWKTQASNRSVLRVVYRITAAAVDTHKETRAGVTLDSGAGGLVLIKIIGAQLVDGDTVLAEKL